MLKNAGSSSACLSHEAQGSVAEVALEDFNPE